MSGAIDCDCPLGHLHKPGCPNRVVGADLLYASPTFLFALRTAIKRSKERRSEAEREQGGYGAGFLDGFNAAWTAAANARLAQKSDDETRDSA